MDWGKNLNLHLENLLPGIVTLILVALLHPSKTSGLLTRLPACSNDFLLAGALVSVAYVLGAVIMGASRILDKASQWFLRPWVLPLLAIEPPEYTGRSVNREYRETLRAALSGASTEIKSEISRRRERVHLSRAALVPAMLCALLFTPNWNWWFRSALAVAVLVFVLFVYTYLEIAIYDEACLARKGAGAADASVSG